MSVQFIAPGVPLLIRGGSPLLRQMLAGSGSAPGTGTGGSGTGTGSGGTGSGSGSGSGGSTGGTGATGTVNLSDLAVLAVGQSNANFTFYPTVAGQPVDTDSNYAGLSPTAADGIKFWSGAKACEIDGIGNTMFPGNGLYAGTSGNADQNGSWLSNPNTPALYPAMLTTGTWVDPSLWEWGSPDGTNFTSYVAGLSAEQVAAIQGLWWYWGENDSDRNYLEKATFKVALLRFAALTRTLLGKTPAQLPLLLWSCMPSVGTDQGMCMIREVVFEIIADPANCAYLVIGQAADCDPRGSTAVPGGTWSGGDTYHAQDADYGRWVRRASQPIAAAVFAAQGATSGIPAACGTGLGPSLTGASLSGNVVTLTVQHDIGTDLVLAQQAPLGLGWAVMDGGSAALPGVLIPALSCARIDATHLAVTLAGIPCNPPGACQIHYPYGNNRIGSGNAVTDNASSSSRLSGSDPGVALSDPLFDQNMPLQMPVTITNGVAACGLPLAISAVANTGPYAFNQQDFALPEQGTFTHGTGSLTCAVDDMSASGYTAPAGTDFGITSNLALLPTTWIAATRYQTTLWSAYVPMPSARGIYYIVAQSLDTKGDVLARITGSAFTVS